MNDFRTLARRVRVLAVFGLFLGASLAAAEPVKKEQLRKSGSSGIRAFRSFACVTQGIACNTTVSGELTADDCPLGDGSNYDAWTFQATAGQTIRMTMRSTAFDTYLLILGPDGFVIDEADDISDTDTNTRLILSVTDTGTYTIQANSFLDFNEGGAGAYTLEIVCSGGPSTCVSNATTLCLNNGRFQVQAIFSAPSLGITNAPAQVVSLTTDTGYFWFFSANNVEIVLKVVDGRSFNNFFWVFYGALSDVEYTITVTDTVNGSLKTYRNSPGHLASVADTAAFPGTGTAGAAESTPLSSDEAARLSKSSLDQVVSLLSSTTALACDANGTTLCLNNGRFQVTAIFSAPTLGITNAPAQAIPLTGDTGYFWFFSANNVEIVLKAVDGRSFNGFFWVFYGALSDVQYTITVTDTVTGAVKTYSNNQGNLASVADTAAFQ